MTFSHPKGVRTAESGFAARPYSDASGFASDLESALEPKFGALTAPLVIRITYPLRGLMDAAPPR